MCEEEEGLKRSAAVERTWLQSAAGSALLRQLWSNPGTACATGCPPSPRFCSPNPGNGHVCAHSGLPRNHLLSLSAQGGAFLNVRKHKNPIVANNLCRKDFVTHVPNLCTFPAIFN